MEIETPNPVAIAVDIGGTKIAVGVVCDGKVLARRVFPTSPPICGVTIARIEQAALACAQEADVTPLAVGVGCTGPVDPVAGLIGDVDLLPGSEGFALVDALETALRLPAVLENDADAGAYGELLHGAGLDAQNLLFVSVGTGIGVGVVIGGQLFRGVGGAHPELGHQTLDASSGAECYCGAKGCWEVLASGTALERWVEERQSGRIKASEIFRLAQEGHALSTDAITHQAHYLGIGLANLVTMFCPDVVVFGGGIMNQWELLLPRAVATASQQCGLVPFQQVRITHSRLGTDAVLIGAAEAGLRHARNAVR